LFSFYENKYSLGELDENQIIKKIQSLEILKDRAIKQMLHCFNHLEKHYVQWVQNVYV
jgi:hypothetical protein